MSVFPQIVIEDSPEKVLVFKSTINSDLAKTNLIEGTNTQSSSVETKTKEITFDSDDSLSDLFSD